MDYSWINSHDQLWRPSIALTTSEAASELPLLPLEAASNTKIESLDIRLENELPSPVDPPAIMLAITNSNALIGLAA